MSTIFWCCPFKWLRPRGTCMGGGWCIWQKLPRHNTNSTEQLLPEVTAKFGPAFYVHKVIQHLPPQLRGEYGGWKHWGLERFHPGKMSIIKREGTDEYLCWGRLVLRLVLYKWWGDIAACWEWVSWAGQSAPTCTICYWIWVFTCTMQSTVTISKVHRAVQVRLFPYFTGLPYRLLFQP